jgi:DNA-directed RNA polymerase II subunit RPB1
MSQTLRTTGIAGDAVGMIAAQSLGQPMTQIALSSFHKAGTSGEILSGSSRITEGVSRMKEIVDANFSNDTSSCYFSWSSSSTRRESTLVYVTVGDLIDGCYFKEADNDGDWWYNIAEIHGLYTRPSRKDGQFLRIEFSKERMLKHRISLFMILENMVRKVDLKEISFLLSPEKEAIIDVVIRGSEETGDRESRSSTERRLMRILNFLIRKIRMEGIERITDFQELENGGVTVGTNLKQLLLLDEIDASSITSTSPSDVLETFGIEAARKVLVEEISKIIDGKIRYDNPHVNLLADFMTFRGSIISINRSSQAMKEQSVLSRASYENTMQELVDACSTGCEHDITRVSETIIVGGRIRIGTGFVEIIDTSTSEK